MHSDNLFVPLFFLFFTSLIHAQLSPHDAILQMQRGINLGNTFDAPDGETSWGNPLVQEYYFDDYLAAGFKAVRVPVTWDKHTATTAPYQIDSTFLARVEQVIDWGLSRGLFIIVNAHHEAWLKNSYSAVNVARFNAIWTQVSSRFKDKSEKLLFEILNEPQPMVIDNLNALNKRILGIIRETNPTRLVVYAGAGYSSKDDLKNVQVPDSSDRYLIANFHCYDPWSWVSSKDASVTWGTDSDVKAIKALFDDIANFMASKNIPLMVNEFGTPALHEYNSRMTFYQTYYENALTHGMASFAWDDGGDFRTYDRQLPQDHKTNGQWVSDVHLILGGNIFSPKGLKAICWSQMSGVQREKTKIRMEEKMLGTLIPMTGWCIWLMCQKQAVIKFNIDWRVRIQMEL